MKQWHSFYLQYFSVCFKKCLFIACWRMSSPIFWQHMWVLEWLQGAAADGGVPAASTNLHCTRSQRRVIHRPGSHVNYTIKIQEITKKLRSCGRCPTGITTHPQTLFTGFNLLLLSSTIKQETRAWILDQIYWREMKYLVFCSAWLTAELCHML